MGKHFKPMKKIFKGKFATVLILVITLILAGIAVFTALRLYQLRQTSVSPIAPSSKPKAQETTPAPAACSLSFTIAPPTFPTCDSKKVYLAANSDDSITDKTVDFSLGDEIQDGGNVAPGEELVYVIKINEISSNQPYTTSDVIDSKLEFINYESTDECTVNSGTNTVSCSATDTGRSNVTVKLKVKVKASLTTGEISNTANITAGQNSPSTCSIGLNISTEPSTPPPSESPTPSGTPNSCGGTCGSNFNCASDLICYQGSCRNPNCTSSNSCVCGSGSSSSTPGPTAPSLPQSGTDWPTVAGFGVGIFVIIGSLLLAL